MPHRTKTIGLVLTLTLASARAYADPPPPESEPPPSAATPPVAPTHEEHETSLRTIGWVMTGVGGGALVGSALMFALQAHESSKLDSEASKPNADVETMREQRDRVDRYHTTGWVLLVTGAASVGAGVSLVLFAPQEHPTTTARLAIGPGNVALAGTF